MADNPDSKARRRLLQAGIALAGAPAMRTWPAGNTTGWLEVQPIVSVDRDSLSTSWHKHSFEARFERKPGIEGVLDGVLVRVGEGANGVKAFCTLCPHEICKVRLEHNEGQETPHFVCPCHQSAFDPLNDGAVINGPAHRGLYRFSLSASAKTIDVVGIEKDVLALFT